jgi:D-sedoheptulose 7-phosphate isomerase
VVFAAAYLDEVAQIAKALDPGSVERLARELAQVRDAGGRLFFIGVGGGAGHASHAVNDFRKIAGFEAYTPSDNVSELTARINDEGWDTSYSAWLEGSRLSSRDALFVFSVGGGDPDKRVSMNLVRAIDCARERGARIFGVVGRQGGYTARFAHVCIVVPIVNEKHVTAHTEGFQAIIWHLLAFHPLIQQRAGKWESLR